MSGEKAEAGVTSSAPSEESKIDTPAESAPKEPPQNGETESAHNARRRVKVYELSDKGQWCDKGTGNVELTFVEAKDAICIVVRSEDEGKILMNSKIRWEDGVYSRQQETLIVWTEPSGMDLAISFQEPVGCDEVWDEVRQIQYRIAGDNKARVEILSDDDQTRGPNQGSDDGQLESYDRGYGSSPVSLATPTLGNLKELEQMILEISRTIFARDALVTTIMESNFLGKLLPLLETCEDLEQTEDLHRLSTIMRTIIFLNDTGIYEYILRDDVFLKVVGMLEYDREFPNMKANHREHLEQRARFKEVVPIKNRDIVAKIVQTYRIQFLKDVVLARLLDDGTFSTLNSLAFFNFMDIVGYIQQDHEFLKELFHILSADEFSAEKKKDVIMFLHELCTIAKTLQTMNRALFFRALGQHGLFAIFEYTLADPDMSIRIAVTAILASILDHDPSLVRSYCMAQDKQGQRALVDFLIERLLEEPDAGLRSQQAEIIKTLMDTMPVDMPEAAVRNQDNDEGADFLTLFYEKYVDKLISPIADLDPKAPLIKRPDGTEIYHISPERGSVCNHVLELLCFAVRNHEFRSKFKMLGQKELLQRSFLLLKAKETYLRLSALRLIRTCVGMKDEFYNRHLIKVDAFGPVLVAFNETKARYNLLNSACLELFEFIKKENIKPLVEHVVTKHRKTIDGITYVDTFKTLVRRYEQNVDPSMENNGPEAEPESAKPASVKDGWGRMDDDEEAYFNEPDKEDDDQQPPTQSERPKTPEPSPSPPATLTRLTPPPSPTRRRNAIEFVRATSPLVDYPDDEDDEDDLASVIARKNKSTSPKAASAAGGTGALKKLSPKTWGVAMAERYRVVMNGRSQPKSPTSPHENGVARDEEGAVGGSLDVRLPRGEKRGRDDDDDDEDGRQVEDRKRGRADAETESAKEMETDAETETAKAADAINGVNGMSHASGVADAEKEGVKPSIAAGVFENNESAKDSEGATGLEEGKSLVSQPLENGRVESKATEDGEGVKAEVAKESGEATLATTG
ncbi:Platinum sensitivity protein [Borealophlyctis nickersoniae]|nr:Platinum sensitivity protein [Borealophlyctis nickersoniae]